MVLVNVMTGPTVLVAPLTVKLAGVMGSLVFLMLAALLELLSVYFLLVSSHLAGRGSYRGLFSHYINAAFPRVADFLLVTYGMTVITLHMIVVRDELSPLLQHWSGNTTSWATSAVFLTPVYAVIVLVPTLLLARTVGRLFVPSLLAFVSMLVLVGAVIWTCFSGHGLIIIDPQPLAWWNWSPNLLLCFAVYIFALTPQLVFFPLVSHFGSSVIGRKDALPIVAAACAGACFFFFVIGLFGYLTLSSDLNSNWLLNLDLRYWQAQLAVVAMLVNASLNFALFSLCTMDSLEHFLFGREGSAGGGGTSGGPASINSVAGSISKAASRDRTPSSSPHGSIKALTTSRVPSVRAVLLAILGLVLVVGIPTTVVILVVSTEMLIVSSVGGATLCVCVCFLLPAIYYMRAWTAPGCCISVRHALEVYVLGGLLVCVAVAAVIYCIYAIVTRQLYIP